MESSTQIQTIASSDPSSMAPIESTTSLIPALADVAPPSRSPTRASILEANVFRLTRESFSLEGITRIPTPYELTAIHEFLSRSELTISILGALIGVLDISARLRDVIGTDLAPGATSPPKGGVEVRAQLESILSHASEMPAWDLHLSYQSLQPYTSCNGRISRILWMWRMVKLGSVLPISFLHHFYYQTLQNSLRVKPAFGVIDDGIYKKVFSDMAIDEIRDITTRYKNILSARAALCHSGKMNGHKYRVYPLGGRLLLKRTR
jgi:hypothetical protein